MANKKTFKLSDCLVFFDFDNTVTSFDTLDDIIQRFAINEGWKTLEDAWLAKRIGSRECLKGQLALVRISKRKLCKYLKKIRISPYFSRILALLNKKNVKVTILSDNFEFIIKYILDNNGIKGIGLKANRVKFRGERLITSFPYVNKECRYCGHCKTKNLPNSGLAGKLIIYIGDGDSDFCPAKKSGLVLAKGNLLRYFRAKGLACVPYKDLKGIYQYFKEINDSER
ncbi:MAG: MtnX-like HAD-IB family phosphatase [Candidatus Omnitrophota bacterium]|nr:MtnX-like HAD-IB family phosphatase [Candidatus Omnitrophota bacterium]MBU1929656.1 MtnX-like HAD-IB family phosphatase [Candidatus Omnitrophota bacterium]MBU2035388.1 MtnX-like HAD-IB family phosphatase [Candidatus Omnitrophota bacterium]MBU2222257.1 MtnX-like HAD-IB family phosphatase [Candidatus Omnitrophota bacterium]MBU2258555.1 MtnX-like HAD-IB family phosphatase [Candidatus Omnitrophota bacterium]